MINEAVIMMKANVFFILPVKKKDNDKSQDKGNGIYL